MKRSTKRLLIFAPVAIALGYVFGIGGTTILRQQVPDLFDQYPAAVEWEAEGVPQTVESIFLSLDVEPSSAPIPKERAGSGGALTSVGEGLVLMTHEGRFFDVTTADAREMSVAPPPNGWDAMLAFEAANPDYTFGHFFFRYNDVDYRDGRLYVSFTEWVEGQDCYRTSIASAPLTGLGDTLATADWTLVFSTAPCLAPKIGGRAIDGHMAGGRFRIDEAGMIWLAAGDYAVDGTYAPIAISQDPEQQYGKVLKIDPATGMAETVSQGHSNMQGITFDGDGALWTVEHGRRGGDELNLIREGLDYGWPQVSLGTRYNRLPLPDTLAYGRHPEFEPPVFSWLPSVAVSALTRVDAFHPAWDGDLLAGTLAGQMLIRLRIRDGRVLFAERINVEQRVRYVHQHQDAIVLWTDQRYVLKLRVGAFDASQQFAEAKIGQLDLSEKQKTAARLALGQCAECHAFGVIPTDGAPALGAVFGAEIASGAFDYSEALRGLDGEWSRDRLLSYLENPDALAPGTYMPDPALTDPAVRGAIVDVLQALKEQPE